MTTQQMQYFLEVVRLHSFTAAAEVLFTTQPSVSRQIAAMEDELGVQLFLRHNNVIELTAAGQELYRGLDRLYTGYSHVVGDVQRAARGAGQHLRIGILPDQQMDEAVSQAVRTLYALQPEMDLDLIRDRNLFLLDGLQEGQLDIAVTFEYPLERGMQSIPLRRDPFCLAVAERLIPEGLNEMMLSDYSQHFGGLPLLINHPNVSNNDDTNEKLAHTRAEIFRLYRLPEPKIVSCAEALVLLVGEGLGAALVNRGNLLGATPGVRLLPLTDVPDRQGASVVALYHPDSQNPLTQEFLNLLPRG